MTWLVIGMLPWLAGPHGHGPQWVRHTSAVIQKHVPLIATAGNWLVARPVEQSTPGELRITFIDVGHGTCVLMQLPHGQTWLYDAGHLGGGQRSHQEIAEVLWSLPTARIDRLFISHADADHYNAIPGLLERFSIGQATASPQFWQHLDPELADLRQAFSAHQLSMTRVVAGEVIECDPECKLATRVLHPPGNFLDNLDNANSLTLLMEYAGRRWLLPGDLEKNGLQHLLSGLPQSCDLLMAPHHGSMTQEPKPLFDWCKPSTIVISGGSRASRDKVIQRYSMRGAQTLVTHRDGAIQWRVSEEGLINVVHWYRGKWRAVEVEASGSRLEPVTLTTRTE